MCTPDNTTPSDEPIHAVTCAHLCTLAQQIKQARRTMLCPPALAHQVHALVDSYLLGGLIIVVPSDFIPTDQVYVVSPDLLTLPPSTMT